MGRVEGDLEDVVCGVGRVCSMEFWCEVSQQGDRGGLLLDAASKREQLSKDLAEADVVALARFRSGIGGQDLSRTNSLFARPTVSRWSKSSRVGRPVTAKLTWDS